MRRLRLTLLLPLLLSAAPSSSPSSASPPSASPAPARTTRSGLPASSTSGFAPVRMASAAAGFLERWDRPALIHPQALERRTLILTYHDVIPDRAFKGAVWFDVTVNELRGQIKFLKGQGASFITLAQLERHLSSGAPLPEKPVLLSFDDNYQGFFEHGYPVLREYGIPAAMFAHTDFVGSVVGRPKMTWNTMRRLEREGLITFGSHSASHPADLAAMSRGAQLEELLSSKLALERELGHEVPYVSYPNGSFSPVTLELARKLGYRLGFTEEWRPAEAGPDLLGVPRYIHTQLPRGWRDAQNGRKAADVFRVPLRTGPVRLEPPSWRAGVNLALIRGGRPASLLSSGRNGVREFVSALGAQAGINGAFFTDALIASSDNTMIGPILTRTLGGSHAALYRPEGNPGLLERIQERPLVLWGRRELMIVPFQPQRMNTLSGLQALMPDLTDAFVGGAWIVHGGVARSAEQLDPMAPGDAWEGRPRVFLGVQPDGRVVLGASTSAASTVMLARAAAESGVQEAVLLDSGYSTSLVFGKQLIAVGRARALQPSRPVPHAIVLLGGE